MGKNKKVNYPCGLCDKHVSKCSKALLCSGNCENWFHLKCISMDLEEYNSIRDDKHKWKCDMCKSVDETRTPNEEEGLTNLELKQEIENLNHILKTLNTELIQTNNENKMLNSRVTKLQEMVLEREEEIVTLKLSLDRQHVESNSKIVPFIKKRQTSVQPPNFTLPLFNSFQALSENKTSANNRQHFSLQDNNFPPLQTPKKFFKKNLTPVKTKQNPSVSTKPQDENLFKKNVYLF